MFVIRVIRDLVITVILMIIAFAVAPIATTVIAPVIGAAALSVIIWELFLKYDNSDSEEDVEEVEEVVV